MKIIVCSERSTWLLKGRDATAKMTHVNLCQLELCMLVLLKSHVQWQRRAVFVQDFCTLNFVTHALTVIHILALSLYKVFKNILENREFSPLHSWSLFPGNKADKEVTNCSLSLFKHNLHSFTVWKKEKRNKWSSFFLFWVYTISWRCWHETDINLTFLSWFSSMQIEQTFLNFIFVVLFREKRTPKCSNFLSQAEPPNLWLDLGLNEDRWG